MSSARSLKLTQSQSRAIAARSATDVALREHASHRCRYPSAFRATRFLPTSVPRDWIYCHLPKSSVRHTRIMAKLEDLTPGASVRAILPDALVTVVSTQWFGSEALELTYKSPAGKPANELLYRHDEARLEIAEQGRPWSFDGDGALFRLVSEAQRIRLAHLFDPVLAVHTSNVEPLPHQISDAIAAGGQLEPLLVALKDGQKRRDDLAQRLSASKQRGLVVSRTDAERRGSSHACRMAFPSRPSRAGRAATLSRDPRGTHPLLADRWSASLQV